jgi:hypothetical protein
MQVRAIMILSDQRGRAGIPVHAPVTARRIRCCTQLASSDTAAGLPHNSDLLANRQASLRDESGGAQSSK